MAFSLARIARSSGLAETAGRALASSIIFLLSYSFSFAFVVFRARPTEKNRLAAFRACVIVGGSSFAATGLSSTCRVILTRVMLVLPLLPRASSREHDVVTRLKSRFNVSTGTVAADGRRLQIARKQSPRGRRLTPRGILSDSSNWTMSLEGSNGSLTRSNRLRVQTFLRSPKWTTAVRNTVR